MSHGRWSPFRLALLIFCDPSAPTDPFPGKRRTTQVLTVAQSRKMPWIRVSSVIHRRSPPPVLNGLYSRASGGSRFSVPCTSQRNVLNTSIRRRRRLEARASYGSVVTRGIISAKVKRRVKRIHTLQTSVLVFAASLRVTNRTQRRIALEFRDGARCGRSDSGRRAVLPMRVIQ